MSPCLQSMQVWTIVRSCILRVIWLERNFRIFNSTGIPKPWQDRARQCALDIKAHVESLLRRATSAPRAQYAALVLQLRHRNENYELTMNGTLFPSNVSTVTHTTCLLYTSDAADD